ncbi:MAG: hypothetical protein PW788_04605 [Micavibrio sp.]|nr:hypothetical protein [Micavibrio sp.]
MRFRSLLPVLFALMIVPGMHALAQKAAPAPAPVAAPVTAAPAPTPDGDAANNPNSRLPDRVVRLMRAIDPITLRIEGASIRLWGIKPASSAETPLELKALDLMDKLIQEQQVNCKIMGGTPLEMVGRCTTQSSQDLALELLDNGYVVVDRRQTYNSVFATAYEKSQEAARVNAKGVWNIVAEEDKKDENGVPKWLKPHMAFLIPMALIFGPFGGLLVVSLIMWYWLKRMAYVQEQEAEQSSRKEAMLINRERHVLISTLEGELTENKNKIEAFLVIYGDMLRTLKDQTEVPKYQQSGDIVQKHPAFGRAVFEANVGKLSLLDIKLAGQVSKLYSAMPKEQEYINLEPNVPLETAVKLVEKILKEAEVLLEPIGNLIIGLQVSQQQKKASAAASSSSAATA